MYRYRLFEADDNEQGEAYYAVIIEAGDIIWADDRRSYASSTSCRSTRRSLRSSGYLRSLPSSRTPRVDLEGRPQRGPGGTPDSSAH
jgi:hypothetical protein